MKNSGLTTASFVFFMFLFNGIQGQTTQQQLDQLKLMKEISEGTWQTVINKDTIEIAEFQQYGDAFSEKVYQIINGKKSLTYVNVFSYSPNDGKFKGFSALANGGYGTWIGSFENEKKFSFLIVRDLNPDKVYFKTVTTFDTPTLHTITRFSPEGVKLFEYKSGRIK
jgi:hypothetical protein